MASREAVEQIRASLPAGNGEQQGFATGATRSSSEGKIDFEGHVSPAVLQVFGEYMHAHRVQRDGKTRASDNWQEGIPLPNYAKSLIRHVQEFHLMWRGGIAVNVDNGRPFTFREVLCAILFNAMGLVFEGLRMDLLNYTHLPTHERQALEAGAKLPARKQPYETRHDHREA